MLLLLGSFRLLSRRRDLSKIAQEVVTLRDWDRESLVGALLLITLAGEIVACFLRHRPPSLVAMATAPFILSGSWAKLSRGKEQLESFKAMLRKATNPEREPVTLDGHVEIMAQRNRYDGRHLFAGLIWIEKMPEITEDMSLLLGDGLHNIRSSLDHLAWHLVTKVARKRLTARRQREVAFPLVKKASSFYPEARSRRLPGVSDPLLALAERFQPYHRDRWGRAMRLLRDLNDIDKHRFVIPGLMVPGNAEFKLKITNGDLTEMKWFPMGRALRPQAHFVSVVGLAGNMSSQHVRVLRVDTGQSVR